ncbi:MAG: hypothetical protein ACYC1Q_01030 [Bacteroidia bacterium]
MRRSILFFNLFVSTCGFCTMDTSAYIRERISLIENQKDKLEVWDEHELGKFKLFFESDECEFTQKHKQRVMSGANCLQESKSIGIKYVYEVCNLYSEFGSSNYYRLISKSNSLEYYDILKYNCSGMKKGLGEYELVHQESYREIIESCKKWLLLYDSLGMNWLRENGVSPLSFSDFQWYKEYGYIPLESEKLTELILSATRSMLADSVYSQYFLSRVVGKRELTKPWKEVVSELAILSLINNEVRCFRNVLMFELVSEKTPFGLVTLESVFNEYFDAYQRDKKFYIYPFIKAKGITVQLNL